MQLVYYCTIYVKNYRFKHTCNDDTGFGRRKQRKLAYRIFTCKFPVSSFTIPCAVELLKVVTSDDIMTSSLKKLSVSLSDECICLVVQRQWFHMLDLRLRDALRCFLFHFWRTHVRGIVSRSYLWWRQRQKFKGSYDVNVSCFMLSSCYCT